MFTGIIEGLGKITTTHLSSVNGGKIAIESDFCIDDFLVGDSMAVNGTCLTATKIDGNCFYVDVSPETLKRTVIGQLKIGDFVNLERALKISDRLDGHLVSGHIDGIGSIKQKKVIGNATTIIFSVKKSISRSLINKGSIAVDGISLTITDCGETSFSVSIIPQTLKMTTLSKKKYGSQVNIETDIVGKYIEQFMKVNFDLIGKNSVKRKNIDIALLSRNGFI